MTELYHSNFRR